MLAATILSGALIGLVLGLVGGGGSILAVPLLVHVVGVGSAHAAIGTAAVAVAANALAGLVGHARAGTVKWRCGGLFAVAGVVGAAAGAELGKAIDGQRLLLLFGLLMIAIGLTMLRERRGVEMPDVRLTRDTAGHLVPRLVPAGLAVGLASGFFGIGGGFLIVPALIAATRMPLTYAVGTSLVVVSALGATTAGSYALSGYVDWRVAGLMLLGGVAGAVAGIALGKRMAARKGLLEKLFAIVVIAVGLYLIVAR
ncbi:MULTISPECIES: sulfite exporter TauE/SafE family protein [unclassified Sphingomonas]|uniref:sulfite exporter TauE/SafE family protein n=1 Tax=unclassified Sphingomonas TaxID=196159 RepID=UPI002150A8A2|nr:MULTISPECIES: sulfite exporter TauE/SafE family protein [unclassified Sphingomonas]MCR5869712.1 sulfite exporter TauE/SafE family protein [Sphingomonas sp. J344]UUX98583.1 sulfite exporter TauE/SafE family protein [Sphingomonas sp. J315]